MSGYGTCASRSATRKTAQMRNASPWRRIACCRRRITLRPVMQHQTRQDARATASPTDRLDQHDARFLPGSRPQRHQRRAIRTPLPPAPPAPLPPHARGRSASASRDAAASQPAPWPTGRSARAGHAWPHHALCRPGPSCRPDAMADLPSRDRTAPNSAMRAGRLPGSIAPQSRSPGHSPRQGLRVRRRGPHPSRSTRERGPRGIAARPPHRSQPSITRSPGRAGMLAASRTGSIPVRKPVCGWA